MAKNFVVVNNRVVRMEDSTYEKYASKHYGAIKKATGERTAPPVELLNFTKPGLPKMKIEPPKVLRRKPVEEAIETPKVEEVKPVTVKKVKKEEPVELTPEVKTVKKTTKK